MVNMMEEDLACDQSYVGSVLPYYMELARIDPQTMIPAHESDSVLARAMHKPAEDELQWIGGAQKVTQLVATLKGMKH